jgi:hypothetical protein
MSNCYGMPRQSYPSPKSLGEGVAEEVEEAIRISSEKGEKSSFEYP